MDFRLASILLLLVPSVVCAATRELTYEGDVRPVLKKHCFHCHGEGKIEGGLDVRLRRLLAAGGDSGPAIVPKRAGESLLIERLTSGEMPPAEVHIRPTIAEIDVVRRWIAAGAKTARPEPENVADLPLISEEDRQHWSFQPIGHPKPPATAHASQVRTPVDAFLLARLEQAGLGFSPAADRATFIRRATFDLLGLPPTPEEVDAFVADRQPDAFERLIDRLLASPHYGERWGRHWLDVAGYADSEGYNDLDTPRDDAWRYRDYVIRAFNADKPFNEFIIEQLAGDELVKPPYKNLDADAIEKLTATGFLRMAPDGTGTVPAAELDMARNEVVAETIKIVSTSLLGLTVGCAQCHDHRYDPIPQTDYYRLRAVFEPALNWKQWREPRLRRISVLSDEQLKEVSRLEVEVGKLNREQEARLIAYRDWVFREELKALPAAIRAAAEAAGLAYQKDPKKLTPEQQKLLADYPVLKVSPSPTILNLYLEKYHKADELKKLVDDFAARTQAIRDRKPKEEYIRALTEVPGQVPATYVFRRGDRTQPGAEVVPGGLTVLAGGVSGDFPKKDSTLPTTGRRLALARRLTDENHPLTPRVLVNRVWMHHFGRGLVATPADFGTQGERPSHPELLDWLARRFIDNGWELKPLHKTIMLSTAYRQSTARNTAGDGIDVENRLLWRMPVRRLEAETIRDAILAVSGRLNQKMYGPSVATSINENNEIVVGGAKQAAGGEEFRRSVYVQVRRSAPVYMLAVFDAPQMEPNCELRNASTVAPQSLAMMNSQFIVEQADELAKRVMKEAADNPQARIERAWRLAFAGEPSPEQLQRLLEYLKRQSELLTTRQATKQAPVSAQQQALASLCQVLLGSSPFLYVD